jgi:predicted transcriptional regulator
MKQHKGMRPHDLVVLLKINCYGNKPWLNKDLAKDLKISASEISESLNRSTAAGLIDSSKKRVFNRSLIDFITHGLKYVFPAIPSNIVKGIPTAQGASIMKKFFHSEEIYVWPDASGKERGICIEPLYPNAGKACLIDEKLYELLVLCDVIRIGKAREIKIAKEVLNNLILKKNVASH